MRGITLGVVVKRGRCNRRGTLRGIVERGRGQGGEHCDYLKITVGSIEIQRNQGL